MKKIWNYLRSMRFGILLLVLIGICSVIGSVIPQGEEISWYVERYPRIHPLLLILQLYGIFRSWYFVLLMALLGLNLTLCSVLRIFSLLRERRDLLPKAAALPDTVLLTDEGVRRLEEHLTATHCRRSDYDGVRVYSKNLLGRYGSFLTHLSILLTLIFGAAGLYLPQTVDRDCLPGESVVLEDGAEFAVSAFRTTDEEGKLDYVSDLSITLPDGRSRSGETSVNHPMSLGPYKVYQQTSGTAGSVTVTNTETGGSDDFLLPDLAFLTIDNYNGLWVLAVYPDYYVTPEGVITPTGSTYGDYPNPVYLLQRSEDGENTQEVAFPGTVTECAGLSYRFNDPVPYPGLRIKYTPPAVNTLLFASFVLMIVGLYITFFLQPVIVRVDDEGYTAGGPKPEGMRIELRYLLKEYEREEKR
ncbi:MAG: cytochrome c biogenesis protein ResB [Oscillospiraceae bacterium]|nr:cytochrome c biogenesis protein ResB [Oscillospiraceae bacterium]